MTAPPTTRHQLQHQHNLHQLDLSLAHQQKVVTLRLEYQQAVVRVLTLVVVIRRIVAAVDFNSAPQPLHSTRMLYNHNNQHHLCSHSQTTLIRTLATAQRQQQTETETQTTITRGRQHHQHCLQQVCFTLEHQQAVAVVVRNSSGSNQEKSSRGFQFTTTSSTAASPSTQSSQQQTPPFMFSLPADVNTNTAATTTLEDRTEQHQYHPSTTTAASNLVKPFSRKGVKPARVKQTRASTMATAADGATSTRTTSSINTNSSDVLGEKLWDECNMYSKGECDVTKVTLYLNNGANIEYKGRVTKSTPVIQAAMHGHVDAVRVLLDHGANIDAQSRNGYTALLYASGHGHTTTVQLLLSRGANVNNRNKYGENAFSYAVNYDRNDTVQLLLEYATEQSISDGIEHMNTWIGHRRINRRNKYTPQLEQVCL